MSYIDKYPRCIDCPVEKYCGTVVATTKLCNSLDTNANTNNEHLPR